mmetsp:Transcript_44865/g.100831  ORF Transcript_44865/g.100831 Transcript_44865/m.100831 type:complete len:367 (-) Transcript_44865:207-1307(-)
MRHWAARRLQGAMANLVIWRRSLGWRSVAAVALASPLLAALVASFWRLGADGHDGAHEWQASTQASARRLLQPRNLRDEEPHRVWIGGAYSGNKDPMTMEFCSLSGDCDVFSDAAPLPPGARGSLGACADRGGVWCSVRPPLEDLFSPVDGGSGRACRRTSETDNKDVYYHIKKLQTTASFAQCQGLCLAHEHCMGVEHIEFAKEHRCEIWSQRIMATRPVKIASCLRHENWLKAPNCCMKGSCGSCEKLGKLGSFDARSCAKEGGQWCVPFSPWYGLFAPVDGGVDVACRGAEPWDNDPSYFKVHTLDIKDSITQCKRICIDTPNCKGIEYLELAKGPRCEIWTRQAGIGAGKHLVGATCLRWTR